MRFQDLFEELLESDLDFDADLKVNTSLLFSNDYVSSNVVDIIISKEDNSITLFV